MTFDSTGLNKIAIAEEGGWEALEADYLPVGAEGRVYRSDDGDGLTVLKARFPAGYIEPRHVHDDMEHWGVVVEGEMHADGRVFGIGDYFHAPLGLEHGPFSYPNGCTVFVTMRGQTGMK
jgi:anti-sigma factor ChrR (cupin superfamily)